MIYFQIFTTFRYKSLKNSEYYDQEVDAIIGDAKVAIEIKSSEEVKTRHKNGKESLQGRASGLSTDSCFP